MLEFVRIEKIANDQASNKSIAYVKRKDKTRTYDITEDLRIIKDDQPDDDTFIILDGNEEYIGISKNGCVIKYGVLVVCGQ